MTKSNPLKQRVSNLGERVLVTKSDLWDFEKQISSFSNDDDDDKVNASSATELSQAQFILAFYPKGTTVDGARQQAHKMDFG